MCVVTVLTYHTAKSLLVQDVPEPVQRDSGNSNGQKALLYDITPEYEYI